MIQTDFAKIVMKIAYKHRLPEHEVVGPSKMQHHVDARDEVVVALRKLGWSYPRIGMKLGNRHHTSIMHLAKRNAARMAKK